MNASQRNRLLALVFLSQSFNFAGSLLPSLLSESGRMSSVQAGFALALSSLLAGFWQPVTGIWLDRGQILRTFWIVFFAYSIGIAGFLIQDVGPALTLMSAIAVVLSSATSRTLVSAALVARFTGEERAKASALRYFVANAAMSVACLLALLLFKEYRAELLLADWVTTLLLAGGLSYRMTREKKLVLRRPMPGLRKASEFYKRLSEPTAAGS